MVFEVRRSVFYLYNVPERGCLKKNKGKSE